jgi:hypothetical protein
MRDSVPKREAVMDNEAYNVTEDANGDKRRVSHLRLLLRAFTVESCPSPRNAEP